MKKKLFALLMALILVLSLAACGGGQGGDTKGFPKCFHGNLSFNEICGALFCDKIGVPAKPPFGFVGRGGARERGEECRQAFFAGADFAPTCFGVKTWVPPI